MSAKQRSLLVVRLTSAGSSPLENLLKRCEYDVHVIEDIATIAPRARPEIDLVMLVGATDVRQVMDVGRRLRAGVPNTPLVLVTTHGSEELATAALRGGFCDYLNQSASDGDILASIQCQLPAPTEHTGVLVSTPTRAHLFDLDRMIGESKPIQEVKSLIASAAPTDSNVLITGETGTGKELTAELIHRNSRRREKPLVCINCAAIPDNLLESELFGYERGAFTGAYAPNLGKLGVANGGTVFFDEIGDMSPFAQAKILRAIEMKEVQRLGGRRNVPLDVRVIAGTNQNLDSMVEEHRFRSDLYFRLNVARIHLPPLRERKSDLRLLLEYAIRELNHRFGRRVRGLTESALDLLLDYDWPGNVRELRNLLEAMFLILPPDTTACVDIPSSVRGRLDQRAPSRRVQEKERLVAALLATNWNKSKAAEQLRWSRMTLYRKISKYQLNRS
jgi:DNA-binding NtrC family response regulator